MFEQLDGIGKEVRGLMDIDMFSLMTNSMFREEIIIKSEMSEFDE